MDIAFYLPQETQQPERDASAKKSKKQSQQCQTVLPGQAITTESGFLRGHGTYEQEGVLYASICGIVERVNKLVAVKPLQSRYQPEVGDVVVGRIAEVAQKCWKVDMNGKQNAILMLSALNLPGGALRRRTTADELEMRNFFVENDVISAEVQQIRQDGVAAIHTRNFKYGKLTNGLLVKVPSSLIKRVKSHFFTFSFGVDVILGNNGCIWVSATTDEQKKLTVEQQKETTFIPKEYRDMISRVRNCIIALCNCFIAIYPDTIMDTYEASLELQLATKDLLHPNVMQQVTQVARSRTS